MQLDDATFAAYKGTELENAVAYDNQIRVMKRDPETDYCVKFTDGICAIHKEQGPTMLGDACNFYPRVTRSFGSETIVTASLSCPEIARLSLFTPAAGFTEIETERLPSHLNNYQDAELTPEQCLKIHTTFLDACTSTDKPELVMARIYSTALSLSRIAKKDWPDASGFFLKTADARLPKAIIDSADKYKLLQIFAAVMHATGKKRSERLVEAINHTENTLGYDINWNNLELSLRAERSNPESRTPSMDCFANARNDEVLKNYIASQLSFTSFPFAGLGENPVEKAKLMTFKFALTKILITGLTNEAEIIQSIQACARIIDHIASPQLIFNLMEQFGWNNEGRIIGLFIPN